MPTDEFTERRLEAMHARMDRLEATFTEIQARLGVVQDSLAKSSAPPLRVVETRPEPPLAEDADSA